MSDSAPDDVMSWEDLIYLADLFQAGRERRFPLLGGEPTLHGEFVEMVLYLLARGFEVNVFTSGVLSRKRLQEAEAGFLDIHPEKLTFICNLNDPSLTPSPPAEQESVRRFLDRFGHRTVPGFNIYRKDFDLRFILELINEFGLKRTIRLGLAHPIPGRDNQCIALEDIDAIIDRLFSFAPFFEQFRVKPGLDCGFRHRLHPRDRYRPALPCGPLHRAHHRDQT